jgi:hypothetical protein
LNDGDEWFIVADLNGFTAAFVIASNTTHHVSAADAELRKTGWDNDSPFTDSSVSGY